tara:strand:+ start:61 stop:378 length:318 start_codon:yes stop_codon:yes gene_type:complete
VFNLDSRELIERNGIATQFVFYVNNIDALTAYVLSSVNEEMLKRRNIIREHAVHIEDIDSDINQTYVVFTVSDDMLHHEDFIVSNIRIGFKQEYEYIGAVIIYAE